MSHKSSRPWYKEPYVWLILGGPAVVVVASFVTFGLAVKNPDPVLTRQPAVAAEDASAGGQSSTEQRAQDLGQLPAMQARNHVMTPNVPKK